MYMACHASAPVSMYLLRLAACKRTPIGRHALRMVLTSCVLMPAASSSLPSVCAVLAPHPAACCLLPGTDSAVSHMMLRLSADALLSRLQRTGSSCRYVPFPCSAWPWWRRRWVTSSSASSSDARWPPSSSASSGRPSCSHPQSSAWPMLLQEAGVTLVSLHPTPTSPERTTLYPPLRQDVPTCLHLLPSSAYV